MRFLEVKAEGLRAAAGATDFSVLFISFSFFIIASAAMLVGLLFSLGIQARAAEIGLLLAVGYTLKRIRRRMLGEGGVVAAIRRPCRIGGRGRLCRLDDGRIAHSLG